MKKKLFWLIACGFASSLAFAADLQKVTEDANYTILLTPFSIYTDGKVAINHPYPGFLKKELPTNNDYNDPPGCYIMCYSHDAKNGIYQADTNIYVMGQIRVPGGYHERMCIPAGFGKTPDEAAKAFKKLCADKIHSCGQNCWSGGDTGGWFGIQ